MFLAGNTLMQAISRTLVHSLWQGLIMAVLAGAVVLLTKKLKPAVRYAMLAGLMVCFLAATVVTFNYELQQLEKKITQAQPVNMPQLAPAANAMFITVADAPEKAGSFTQKAFAFFTAHAQTIVLGWLLIIAFRCLQMFVGLRGVHVLKSKGITDAGAFLNMRFKQLCQSLNIRQNVQLFQSVIAKVPMAIGHFKPVILLPAGIITALPQDEIEAILLHELAHIRRKDYLVNMLQNFCEILFFFNPAVLWVSSLIKDERENCCDDVAVHFVQNKKQFIHALISFQEYNIAASKYAPGFPGKKDHLLHRVKRIITNNNKTLTNMEKTFLATGIVLMSFVTIAFSQTKKQPVANNKQHSVQQEEPGKEPADSIPPPENPQAVIMSPDGNSAPAAADTVPPGNDDFEGNSSSLTTDYKGKSYRLIEKDNKLVELWVEGVKIPPGRFNEFKSTTDSLLGYMHEQQKQFAYQREQYNRQAEKFKQQAEKFKEQEKQFTEEQKEMEKYNDSTNKEQFKLQGQKFKEQMKEFKLQQDLYKQQKEQYKALKKQYKLMADSVRTYSYNNLELTGPVFSTEPAVATSPEAITDVKPLAAIAATPAVSMNNLVTVASAPSVKVTPAVVPAVSIAPVVPVVAQPDKIVTGILTDLKDAGVEINNDKVSLKLNNKELVVNGITQPEPLHTKLRAKYSIGLHDEVKYMTNAGETSSSISTNLRK